MISRSSALLPAALRPFVQTLWFTRGRNGDGRAAREHVLPTGTMTLVLRLSDPPLRLHEGPGAPRTVGHAIVGGARSAYYVRDVSEPVCSVGAQLRPGAARALLGVPAGALAERHTRLDDLWGAESEAWRERLAAAPTPHAALDRFQALLLARLPAVRGMHPAVAQALGRLAAASRVDAVVRASGYSHRGFIAVFRDAVGLPPKTYARVLRLQGTLARIAGAPDEGLAAIAAAGGYADQAHFAHDFRAFTGMTPGRYRRSGALALNHVPVNF